MAAADAEQAPSEAVNSPPPKKQRALRLLLVLLVLGGAAGAGYHFYGAELLEAQGGAEAKAGPPLYIALDSPFVVNLEDSDLLRFLQVELQLMTRDPKTPAAVEMHTPVIRNNLMLILASANSETLGSREGKKALQQRLTDEINAILVDRAGGVQIEETYFTSFVMQ